ncbi:MAG: hypothetical protein U0793_03370 [Gemmataceae bacterium]
MGIRIGIPNRNRYFKGLTEAIIEVAGTEYVFQLKGGFWRDCPELRGRSLREFLRRHKADKWGDEGPPTFELTELSKGRFRLEEPKASLKPASV